MTSETNSDNSESKFSRAFDLLVSDSEDVVGLLAYARYKQSIRESALAGVITDSAARNLPPATVNAFRSAAEKLITRIAENAIETATPEILNSSLMSRVGEVQADLSSSLSASEGKIIDQIKERTSFISSFLPNLVAWFVTLLIAVAILFMANRPGMDRAAVQQLDRLSPPTESQRK